MDALTIQQAAQTTDWSPRMLRYIEDLGLIEPQRSEAGYRLYGPGELQRLRTLRELTARFDIGLGEIGFAKRLRNEDDLASTIAAWFEAQPRRPDDVPPAEWLRWEQDKHSKLLALAAAHARPVPTPA